MTISDIPLPVYYVAIPVVYLFLGGLTFGMIRVKEPGGRFSGEDQSNKEMANIGSVFWPVVWVGWIVYQIATAGPRLIRSIRERRKRLRIPRAEVVSK